MQNKMNKIYIFNVFVKDKLRQQDSSPGPCGDQLSAKLADTFDICLFSMFWNLLYVENLYFPTNNDINISKLENVIYRYSLRAHLSRTQMTVFPGSSKFRRTSLMKPSSFPSEYSTWTTFLFKILKFGESMNLTLCLFLTSSSWALGMSLSFRKASIALMNLYFLRYSCVSGIRTSQMTVTPATKNGLRLKKSSIDTRICSMLIFCETCSESAALAGKGEEKAESSNAKLWRKDGILEQEAIFWVETWRSIEDKRSNRETGRWAVLRKRMRERRLLDKGEAFSDETWILRVCSSGFPEKVGIFRAENRFRRGFAASGGGIWANDLALWIEMQRGTELRRWEAGKQRGTRGFGKKRWSCRAAIGSRNSEKRQGTHNKETMDCVDRRGVIESAIHIRYLSISSPPSLLSKSCWSQIRLVNRRMHSRKFQKYYIYLNIALTGSKISFSLYDIWVHTNSQLRW